jgi:hypothetical protein
MYVSIVNKILSQCDANKLIYLISKSEPLHVKDCYISAKVYEHDILQQSIIKKYKSETENYSDNKLKKFLKMFILSFTGTLADKLYLFTYCKNNNILRKCSYFMSDEQILYITKKYTPEYIEENYITMTTEDKKNCIYAFQLKKQDLYIDNSIYYLTNKIEEIKLSIKEIQIMLFNKFGIYEEGICKIITDYAFSDLQRTILFT